MEKVNILNIDINKISVNEALNEVTELAISRAPSYVCFVNAHMTVEANRNKKILKVVNSANYAFADGAPVAKAFQVIKNIDQERIAGMDFFPLMLQKCHFNRLNVGLIGTTESILNKIEAKIKKEFPQIVITHKISPPFGEVWDNNSYIDKFNSSKTNIVFVAFGCPKQEIWMNKVSSKINAVLLGVGGALPVYAGEITRAPKWMRNNGLEWFYRLVKEPRRMWKRYLYTNTIFLKMLFKKYLLK